MSASRSKSGAKNASAEYDGVAECASIGRGEWVKRVKAVAMENGG
jgi:hypothetical protein